MTSKERKLLKKWEDYKADLFAFESDEMITRTPAEIYAHRVHLEVRPIEWIRFFFEKHLTHEFADFHLRTILRCIENAEWFEVLSWARSLAKSTTTMFVVLYLMLTGRKKCGILASATQDSAKKLLLPYRLMLDKNPRIKAYYGDQVGIKWTDDHIVSKSGFTLMAIGEGNAPRGAKNENVRPDVLLVDDFDTDEACRNPETLKNKWDWWEGALYPTRDIAIPTLVIFCGNIIARDCCITRAGALADHWDVVNVRDEEGKSTWRQKNSEDLIDLMLRGISSAAVQKEYYNNPVTEGKVFRNLVLGKVPSLKKFEYLVAYGDPANSESKGGKNKKASYKGVGLMGIKDDKLYIIKCYLDHGLNADFIQWFFDLHDHVGGKTNIYHYIEDNTLQDPFYSQVFKPLLRAKNRKRRPLGMDAITVNEDKDKKTDKATRIEANLEPLDRDGRLIFNEAEADNPHMIRLMEQFRFFELNLPYPADGPDFVEGGYRVLKTIRLKKTPTKTVSRSVVSAGNKHRM